MAYWTRYRFEKQIINGIQPYEFIRASSVHYLTFNTKALTNLATVAATMGVDLWRRGLRHGYSLKDAWDFAVPHVVSRVHFWPWNQARCRTSLRVAACPFYQFQPWLVPLQSLTVSRSFFGRVRHCVGCLQQQTCLSGVWLRRSATVAAAAACLLPIASPRSGIHAA